ncbi:MAG: efflux RND transporter periplasmic adaptor subunit [Alphaproteobacteria bacterium]|nr:MAG: efflux RND transporter periplasmic adaptor subunit [Alphaproteobacteria bacterium]
MQPKNKKTLYFLIFLTFLALAVYFKDQLFPILSGVKGSGTAATPAAAAPAGQMPATPVETVVLQLKPMAAEVKAVGTLQADESVILKPEVAGRIAQIHFKEGESVKKDQVLISLDDSLYRAELQESIASRDLAKQIYERSRALFDKGTGTANARDDNRLKWQAAEASVNLSRARLAKMQLLAPFDGVIGVRSVSVGDYVAPGQDLAGITKLDPLKLDFRIAETYLNNVQVGQKINLTTATMQGQVFTAEIYAIDPQIDAETRSVILRAYVPNHDQVLRPGAFAQISIPLGNQLTALMIPEQSVIPTGGSQFVYKVVDGKAVNTTIKTGFRDQGLVQVTEGLSEGDEVVTAGQMKIRDGAPVSAIRAAMPAPADKKEPDGEAPPAAKAN